MLDIETSFFLLMATCVLVGVMMLIAWTQNRRIVAYLWWAGGFLAGACGLALTVADGFLPDKVSFGLGTVILLLGLGFCWAGARSFDSRPIQAWPVAFGVLAWSAVYMIPQVQASPEARSMVMSLLIAGYSIAIGFEFWNGRGEALSSRMPLAVLCVVNGIMHLGRVLLTLFNVLSPDAGTADFWFAMSLFQPALIMVAGGLYGIGIGRDRTEQELRDTANTDALTRVLNRGAVLDRAEALLDEASAREETVALLLFDLDRFKAINDTLGHHAGDMVLQAFANVARECLRGSDLLGRIGGEEFVAFLPKSNGSSAQLVAERVRERFAALNLTHNDTPIEATVSAGVVALSGRALDLDRMMSLADRALYDAKRGGRDQVRNALVIRGHQRVDPPLARSA